MNKTDILWQSLIDEEKTRWSGLPAEELCAMEDCTSQVVQRGSTRIEYGFFHESPDDWSDIELHSFILLAQRQVWPFPTLYSKYLAGFSLDSTGNVIPIADDVLYKYD